MACVIDSSVLHGTWIPENHERFTQSGNFYLWVESETTNNENNANNEHPRTLQKPTLTTFLRDDVGIREISQGWVLKTALGDNEAAHLSPTMLNVL